MSTYRLAFNMALVQVRQVSLRRSSPHLRKTPPRLPALTEDAHHFLSDSSSSHYGGDSSCETSDVDCVAIPTRRPPSTSFTPPCTPPPSPPRRRTSPRFSPRPVGSLEAKAPVLRWKIESQSLLAALVVLCATSAFVISRFMPVITSSAAIMQSSAGAIDAGAGITRRTGDVLYEVSALAIGLTIGVGRAWCQAIGIGCEAGLSTVALPGAITGVDWESDQTLQVGRRMRTGALIKGEAIIFGLNSLQRVGRNASAPIDMNSLGLELQDKISFQDTAQWSQHFFSMAPNYHRMRTEKDKSLSRAFNLLRNVVDMHNNVVKRSEIAHSMTPWYRRSTLRHPGSLSHDMTDVIARANDELQAALESVSLTAKAAGGISEKSEKILASVRYQLRKLGEERRRHPVLEKLCYGVGDFQLGPLGCEALERDRMISLLRILDGTLRHYVSDAGEVALISNRLHDDLNAFVRALNFTAGVVPGEGPLRLRSEGGDLLLLGEGVSALSSTLEEIDAQQ